MVISFKFKVVVVAHLCVLLAACAALPRSGPGHKAIERGASGYIPANYQGPPLQYALLDVAPQIISLLPPFDTGSFQGTFGRGRGAAPVIHVSVGDKLEVTIFESASGGLFIPRDAGVRPGNFVTFPAQIVERAGTITVPYAGAIEVVGRTLPEIQQDIEDKLADRAIEPQVIVSFADRASDVAVVGEVNDPDKFQVNLGGDRVLDMIARAGGPRYPGYESYVTLQRAGAEESILFNRLMQDASENIYVKPGDTIYVYREQRFYTAFGASGEQGRYAFDAERVSLAEAVGKAGGLLDGRANPRQVFLYRLEDRGLLEQAGTSLERFHPEQARIPTIYRLNMREPSTFFLAQHFPMRGGDVLYISNAKSVELLKFLDIVGAVTSTAAGSTTDVRVIEDD